MLKKKIALIVSHDAGAAEIIAAWTSKNINHYNFYFELAGPAKKIFERQLKYKTNIKPLPETLLPDFVLTGTGWASTHEIDNIAYWNSLNVHTATYLDHWVNYKSRFIRNGELHLPNEIWVGDSSAKKIADNIFPQIKIRLVENLYLKNTIEKVLKLKKISPQKKNNALFLCEPLSKNTAASNCGSGELLEVTLLKKAIQYINEQCPELSKLRIRLHPAESIEKYQSHLKNITLNIEYSNETLISDLAWATTTFGITSMALAISAACDIKSYSCLDKKSLLFTLPNTNISFLNLI